MPQTNHGSIEFLKFPNPQFPGDQTKLIKKWLRDSWARRKIVALQQAVAAIVVPTASTANPQMDGTASPGVSTDYSRADHVHPHDSSKANVATTLAGYGITDAYTKTQVDGMIPSVPSASTANPSMDGTASAGSSTAWARGDHVHPTDTSRQAALSTAQMAAVNSGVTAAKVAEWDGITVPTKTSDLTNDSGFVTASAIPTETSDLVNDSGFITAADIPAIPSKTSDLTNDSDFQTGTDVDDAISAEAGLMVPYGYCTTAAGTVAKTVTVSPAVTALETGLTVAVKFQYANTGSNPTLNVNSLGAVAIKRYGTTAAGTSAAANWNANSVVMLVYDGTYWMLADWNNTTYSGMTDAEYQAGTSTSNRLITPARLKAAIELHAPVQSVNGQTGAVTVPVPTKTSDLTNDSGFITSAPVTSVNGQTGAVTLDAADVGALPDSTTIPTKTSDLTNDSGFITSAPVASVNGQTGAVSLDAADVGALPNSTVIPSKTSQLTNDSGYITASSVPSASSATPAMDGTGAAGSSADYARADHVHPHDTSKQDALNTAQLAAVNSGITADDLAVNDPTVLCGITPIYPTLDVGNNSSALGNTYYYKIGHRVHVHLGATGLTQSSTQVMFTLPAGYIPLTTVGVCCLGSSFTTYSRIRVGGASTSSPGAVSVNPTTGGVLADFDFDAFA